MNFLSHTFSRRAALLTGAFASILLFSSCSCPTDSANAFSGKQAVIIVGEHEYGTPETLPAFAKKHLDPLGIETTVVRAKSDDRESVDCHNFEGMDALDSADILILSTRRRFPPSEDLAKIRQWIESGKPLIAIRTASHAFGERTKGTGYQAPDGHASWNTFDLDVLGAKYDGHYKSKEGQPPLNVEARIEQSAADHPIVKMLSFEGPILIGDKLYEYPQQDPEIKILMSAHWKEGEPSHPVAWTNQQGGKQVFYMSPGGVEEMALPEIQELLLAAVQWGLQ